MNTRQRWWLLVAIFLNLAILIGAIWVRQKGADGAENPVIKKQVMEKANQIKKLMKEGIIVSSYYRLKNHKILPNSKDTYMGAFDDCPMEHRDLFGVYRDVNALDFIGIYAHRDDVPEIEKALERWDGAPVEKRNPTK